MIEHYVTPGEQKASETVARLRDRTPEEKAAQLARGLEMMREDHRENMEFFDEMAALRGLKNVDEKRKSDELYVLNRQAYGALGYDPNVRLESQRH